MLQGPPVTAVTVSWSVVMYLRKTQAQVFPGGDGVVCNIATYISLLTPRLEGISL